METRHCETPQNQIQTNYDIGVHYEIRERLGS
jgi:hypothetical protein